MEGVCGAAARAIKACPTVAAFLSRINVTRGKFILRLGVRYTVEDIAKLVFILTNELMAGIKIAPRGDRHIFGARAASRDALIDTRTAREVDHIMIEGEGTTLTLALKHKACK